MAFTTPAIGTQSRVVMNPMQMSSAAAVSSTTSTGPAKNFEEDLQLTLAIIMDHVTRSTTVGKEQFLQQVEEIASIPDDIHYDISIPYHAAAELAYEKSTKDLSLDDYIVQFEQQAVADVIAKKVPAAAPVAVAVVSAEPEPAVVVDISVPYDAAALLAYEKTDKSVPFDTYKIQYYEQAVAWSYYYLSFLYFKNSIIVQGVAQRVRSGTASSQFATKVATLFPTLIETSQELINEHYKLHEHTQQQQQQQQPTQIQQQHHLF